MWGGRGDVGPAFLCNISGELESFRACVNVYVRASLMSRAICTSVLALEYARVIHCRYPSPSAFDLYYERAMKLALPRSKFSVVFTVRGNAAPVLVTGYT